MRARSRIRLALIAVTSASALLWSGPVGASSPTPYGTNLVKNPGAESGAASSTIPHWDPFLNFAVVTYGTSGYPTHHKGNQIGGQSKFFTTGAYDDIYSDCGDAHQNVPIKGRGAAIDSGHVKLSASVQRYTGGTRALGYLQINFEDSQHNGIGAPAFVPMRGLINDTKWFKQFGSHKLPHGTRNLDLRLYSAPTASNECGAVFDNLVAKLTHV